MSTLSNMFGGGGGSVPKFDTTPLKNILNKGRSTQTDLATNLPGQVAPLTEQFGQKQTNIGNDLLTGTKTLGQDYVNSLNNPTLRDEAVGKINENAFRNVGASQQAIKESLAGTGRLGNGRATNLLAQPVLQAAQQAGDQATNYDVAQNDVANAAKGTAFNANHGALLSKVGLDSDTARTLMENGRGDLIQKAANLLGIEGDYSQGLFNLENTRQQSDIASAQADQQRKSALLNSLLGVGGTIGGAMIAGPAGAAVGGKLLPTAAGAVKAS